MFQIAEYNCEFCGELLYSLSGKAEHLESEHGIKVDRDYYKEILVHISYNHDVVKS
jgi:hypothetical protein